MRLIAAGAAVVSLVATVFLVRPGFVEDFDRRACDIVTGWAGPGQPSGRVAVVDIDEKSLAETGRWPWPRDVFASLVRRILDGGAAVVALDLMFPEEDPGKNPGGQPHDDAFAAALAGEPAVIGYSFTFDRTQPNPACLLNPLPVVIAGPEDRAFFRATGVVCSVPAISRAAAASGFLNAAPDGDGRLRRVPLVIAYEGNYYPSLALAALMLDRHSGTIRLSTGGGASLRLDSTIVPVEGPSAMRLRFRGRQRSLPYISAADLMGERPSDPRVRNKIVVVGASALGIQSSFSTPVDPLFPASELQATAIDNLLQQDFFSRPSTALWEVALALIAGFASMLALAKLRWIWATIVVAAIGAGMWIGSFVLLAQRGLLLSPLPVSVTLGCTYFLVTLVNYLLEKRKVEQGNRRYRQLVENIDDAIVMNDRQGRLTFANALFREWFGLENRDICEVNLEDYVAPEWVSAVRETYSDWLGGKPAPDRLEYEGLRPDGTRIRIEALISITQEHGKIVGTQSALRDVTARKQMEAEYLQAQKMEIVGRVAGGVAHDFNNLLQVINGYSALMLGRVAKDSEFRADLEEIRWAGMHAAELTKRMLVFSRKRVAQPEPLDLNPVIEETVSLFRRVVGEDIEVVEDLLIHWPVR